MKNEITINSPNKTFDRYAVHVLEDRLEQLPQEPKRPRRYTITKTLPETIDNYKQLRDAHYTWSTPELIHDAFSVAEELAVELREWYDNMPESLRGGDKASQLEAAAESLESLSPLDVPEFLGELKVIHLPIVDSNSRPARLYEAVHQLDSAVKALEQWVAEQEAPINTNNHAPESERRNVEVKGIIEQLNNVRSEFEFIDIPGMY